VVAGACRGRAMVSVLVYRRGIAASRHAHVQVAAVRGTKGTWRGVTPRGLAAAVAVAAAAGVLLGIAISVVLFALTRLGVNGYVALGAEMLAVGAFRGPLGLELRYIKTQGDGRGGRLGDGARRVREVGHRGPVAIASNFAAHPQKHGHGNEVMRAWLAHADAHRIAVVADARDEGCAAEGTTERDPSVAVSQRGCEGRSGLVGVRNTAGEFVHHR